MLFIDSKERCDIPFSLFGEWILFQDVAVGGLLSTLFQPVVEPLALLPAAIGRNGGRIVATDVGRGTTFQCQGVLIIPFNQSGAGLP